MTGADGTSRVSSRADAGSDRGREPRIGAIWAQDRTGLLGADGDMLWRVPADFRHFKAATLGGVVLMGRTTWDSIGAALPGRTCVVLTRRPGWEASGAVVRASLAEGLAAAQEAATQLPDDPREGVYRRDPRMWVIGGGSVYDQALEAGVVDELVVTTLDLDATAVAASRGLTPGTLVRAPRVDPAGWARDPQRSDPAGTWREVSRDAAWRVDRYTRRR